MILVHLKGFHSLKVGYKQQMLSRAPVFFLRFHSLKVEYKHIIRHICLYLRLYVFIP